MGIDGSPGPLVSSYLDDKICTGNYIAQQYARPAGGQV
jgi:hypothetical protein